VRALDSRAPDGTKDRAMTTSLISGDCRLVPLNPNNPFGTGLRLECDEPAAAGEPRLLDESYRSGGGGAGELAGGLALGVGGIAAALGGGALGARLGAAGIGRGLGIALGIGAVAGAGYLIWRGVQNQSQEYLVHFSSEADLTGVPPERVYETLRAHHERNAPAVERELDVLRDEGKVRSWSGIVGSNGFVVDVVKRHGAEVERRLEALTEVGEVGASDLS
jgi:hypothetical protein